MKHKRAQKNTFSGKDRTSYLLLGGYLSVLTLFFVGSQWPGWRVWGFNWWAYLGDLYTYSLLAAGIIIGAAVFFLTQRITADTTGPDNNALYITLMSITAAAMMAAYVAFGSTTHFLGDGYQLLSRLANHQHDVKTWDKGAAIIQSAIYAITTGTPQARALSTFRIWSVASGAFFLIGVIAVSRFLFDSNRHRFLFFLGLALGGYSLMFFGYVENYATLIAAMMIYILLGLKAARGEINPMWLLPTLAAAVFIHLFGLLLVPSFLYLVLRKTSLAQRLKQLSTLNKWLIFLALSVLAAVVYVMLYNRNYFFKFMLMPPIRDRFTVEDDMLFSVKHVIDIVNLLLLMMPGVVLYVLMMLTSRKLRSSLKKPQYVFTLITLAATFVTVYVVNPGIGMPRNWDLFSIVGVPLVVLCFYSVLRLDKVGGVKYLAVWLMIALGGLSLAPRVAVNVSDNLAIAHFRDYLQLDRARNRNARGILVDYYKNLGDTARAEIEYTALVRELPEVGFNNQAEWLVDHGEFARAVPFAQRAIQINPLFWDAYANLGLCYRSAGLLDSAQVMLEIADGLNPYNARVTGELGSVALLRNDLDKAERLFLNALALDSALGDPMFGLVTIYLRTNRVEESFRFVQTQHRHGLRDSTYFRFAGDTYLKRGLFDLAAKSYSFALDRGLDSSYVASQRQRFPQLSEQK
ncbi:MAG: tetratricopeptide repeat protein [Candidatus Zixiibacteriota bacterium]